MLILKHKNIDVCKINFDGHFHVNEIFNKKHMPLGVNSEKEEIRDKQFSLWFANRIIPNDRQNLNIYLKENINKIILSTNGVSLTDCYWFTNDNSNLKWEDVNFYDNPIDNSFRKINSDNKCLDQIDFKYPDLTTDGYQEKYWILINKIPNLIKYGDYKNSINFGKNILSANEIIASKIANIMEINSVEYNEFNYKNNCLCSCSCFIKDDKHEFVNALQIKNENKLNGFDLYNWFKENGFQKEIDNMIGFDYLIRNIDRHEKNFGIIRNPDSLEIMSFAPIFDNGTSLLFNQERNEETKPFKNKRDEQLDMVENEIKIPNIEDVEKIVGEVYDGFNLNEKLTKEIISDIKENIRKLKLNNLKIQNERKNK